MLMFRVRKYAVFDGVKMRTLNRRITKVQLQLFLYYIDWCSDVPVAPLFDRFDAWGLIDILA